MQRLLIHSLLIILLLALSGCQKQNAETIHLNGATMGTTWSVSLHSFPSSIHAENLKQRLQLRLDQINGLMSTYDPQSEISRFNDQLSTDWFAISAETSQVIDLALKISEMSNGAFDISVGPLVELWGFGAKERGKKIPSSGQITHLLAQVGYQKLKLQRGQPALKKLHPQLRIDLSAIAKGYAVDQLAEILRQRKVKNFMVEVGGELQLSGRRTDGTPWRIAIEKPLEGTREVATIFPLSNTALATSGNYRNFYIEDGQRYVHTIDPVSGKPIRHKLGSVTILDRNCARADALATALMVMGEDKGRLFCQKNNIAAFFLIHEKDAIIEYISPAFEAFIKQGDK